MRRWLALGNSKAMMVRDETGYLLEMREIKKSYYGHPVLDRINLRVKPGEIHGLLGKNGAGKTTLVNILYGAVPKDSGEIILNNQPVEVNTVSKARSLGIIKIHQEPNIFPKLTVAENIFVNAYRERKLVRYGMINRETMMREAFNLLAQLHFPLDPRERVERLGVAKQQMVAIARAMAANPRILILDEPTAALNEQETEYFLMMLKKIQKSGVTMLYISHRLRELKLIADRVTVIRDGRDVATIPAQALEEEKVLKLMVGLETRNRYPNLALPAKNELLRIEQLSVGSHLRQISFTLHEGEILGIAGLAGSGRTTLVKTLFGLLPPTSGRILLRGREIRPNTARQAIKFGFAYVMEDRLADGLFINRSIMENITATNLGRITKGKLIDGELEKKVAWGLIKRLHIKVQALEEKIQTLSGGNQQKSILARWLFGDGLIYLLDEPTSGLDMASKVDIYNILNSIICRGAGIIMISSDLSELIGMCHRILVMHNGAISGELRGEEATEEKIIKLASG